MAAGGVNYSIVEYFGENDGYRCGYCKSSNTNFSHGMWAHSMAVQDYQDLIDRGWRRSGQYIYKPTMPVICCPMYTIRCSAMDFKLSKSQKKIIKKVHRFLAYGRKSEKSDNISQSSDMESEQGFENVNEIPTDLKEKTETAATGVLNTQLISVDPSFKKSENAEMLLEADISKLEKSEVNLAAESVNTSCKNLESVAASSGSETSINLKKCSKTGVGVDSSRPACKKAKILRLERKKKKLQSKGMSEEEVLIKLGEKTRLTEKTLEDFINEQLTVNPAHRLEIRLVNSDLANSVFEATFDAEYEVYRKYQVAVHGDPPTKCSKRQFTRFLVNSPLKIVLLASESPEMRRTLPASWDLFAKYQRKVHNEAPDECDFDTFREFLLNTPLKFEESGPPSGYGSFHQQYWLDDKLIAVGVIDILPNCVSSVYFYYDPDYSNLSLGMYASLREASFTRSLHYHSPGLKYYYMGFYIESCQKMRYKARLKPSFLLCPETYSWLPFEEANLKIQRSKYSRLNDDKNSCDPDGDIDVDKVLVLYDNTCMEYRTYKNRKFVYSVDDSHQVKEYASLVGMKCASRLLLYRSRS